MALRTRPHDGGPHGSTCLELQEALTSRLYMSGLCAVTVPHSLSAQGLEQRSAHLFLEPMYASILTSCGLQDVPSKGFVPKDAADPSLDYSNTFESASCLRIRMQIATLASTH